MSSVRAPTATGSVENYAVARRMVEVGQLVSEGAAVVELVIDHPLRFRGAAPERFAGEIAVGQNVVLQLASSRAVEGARQPDQPRSRRSEPHVHRRGDGAHEGGTLRPGSGSYRNVTVMCVFFGQLVAHELLDSQRSSCPVELMSVRLGPGDPVFGDTPRLQLRRTQYDPATAAAR
ncbi:MAG: hypothetical protein HC834_07635, partial [Rhodospirillales bacterium]|nr:hypothetical protein [Rhodospirillales bacterium]